MKYFWIVLLTLIGIATTFIVAIPLGFLFILIFRNRFRNIKLEHKPLFLASLVTDLIILCGSIVLNALLLMLLPHYSGSYLFVGIFVTVFTSGLLLIHYLITFRWVYAEEIKSDAPSPRKILILAWIPLCVLAIYFLTILFTSSSIDTLAMSIYSTSISINQLLLLVLFLPIIVFLAHDDVIVRFKSLKLLLASFVVFFLINISLSLGAWINQFVFSLSWHL